jgi:hypothetical protein
MAGDMRTAWQRAKLRVAAEREGYTTDQVLYLADAVIPVRHSRQVPAGFRSLSQQPPPGLVP